VIEATVRPGARRPKLAEVSAPPPPPVWPSFTPKSKVLTGDIVFPPPTFQTAFAWNCHCVTTPVGFATESSGTSDSGPTLPKRPRRSPEPGAIETLRSTPPGTSSRLTVTGTASPLIGVAN